MKYIYSFLFTTALVTMITIAPTASAQTGGLWLHYNLVTPPGEYDIDTEVTGFAFDGGTTWAAMPRGLAKFNGSTWTLDTNMDVIPSNIGAIAFFNGSLWLGSSDGLYKFDGTTWKTYTSDNSQLIFSGVNSIASDPQHNLWIATGGGLSKFTLSEDWTSYNSVNIPVFPSDQISTITIDPNGNAWLGFYSGGGLVKFNVANPLNAQFFSDTMTDFPVDQYLSIAIDGSGNAWAGSFSHGLVWTNGSTAKIWSKEVDPNWISDYVDAVTIDQCGHIWIGTDHGAAVYDGANWTWHTVHTHDLLSDMVYAVSVDPAGHIWFGTDEGITEFKPLPQKPTLLSPANWATIVTDSISCKWYWDCPGILKYWHEIADNPNFTNSHIDTTSASLTLNASKWDTILVNHATYYWRVKAENDAGWGPFSDTWSYTVNKVSGVSQAITNSQTLAQNFPNPCADATTIRFSLANYQHATLKCYDILGREIATLLERDLNGGDYNIPFNTTTIPNGVYFYLLKTATNSDQRTMQVVH